MAGICGRDAERVIPWPELEPCVYAILVFLRQLTRLPPPPPLASISAPPAAEAAADAVAEAAARAVPRATVPAEVLAAIAAAAVPAPVPVPADKRDALRLAMRIYNGCYGISRCGQAEVRTAALDAYKGFVTRLVAAEAVVRMAAVARNDALLIAFYATWQTFVPSNEVLARYCACLMPQGASGSGGAYGLPNASASSGGVAYDKWTLEDVGTNIFRVVMYDRFGAALTAALVDTVARSRRGEEVDTAPLRMYVQWALTMDAVAVRSEVARARAHGTTAVVCSQLALVQFRRDVAVPFVDAAAADITALAAPQLDALPVPSYLAHVEGVLASETERITSLFIACAPELLRVCSDTLAGKVAAALVGAHMRTLIESARGGVAAALVNGAHDDFELAVRVIARVPRDPAVAAAAAGAGNNGAAHGGGGAHWGLARVAEALHAYVLTRGRALAAARGGDTAAACASSGGSGGGGAAAAAVATAATATSGGGSGSSSKGGGGAAGGAAASGAGGGGGSRDAVKDELRDTTYIDAMVALQAAAVRFATQGAAAAHTVLIRSVKEAMSTLMNAAAPPPLTTRPLEKAAAYINGLLATGSGSKLAEEEVRTRLANVEQLAAYCHDADVFERLLRDGMAARILTDRSASFDAERALLGLLKARHGATATMKMGGMLGDLETSEAMADTYAAVPRPPLPPTVGAGASAGGDAGGSGPAACELVPRLLTASFWPSVPSCTLSANLPPQMRAAVAAFVGFYNSVYSHRRLAWPLHQGRVTLTFKPGGAKRFEIVGSPLQAAFLLHAETLAAARGSDAPLPSAALPYSALRDACGVSDAVATRILHSLSCTAAPLLIKSGAPRVVSATDTFTLATGLKSAAVRIMLPQPPLEEERRAAADVEQERQYTTDAAVVRIMKARKRLGVADLQGEVIAQLSTRFRPDPTMIKRRIEHLIEREYLERDVEDHAVLNYVA